MTVSGAYGRDYKSKAAALADWEAGKDFEIRSLNHRGGKYVTKSEALAGGIETVTIRYNNDRMAVVIKP